ncbi:dihydrofolate reductase [Diachasma alloeum]|uniref:dihydrofolate reductase n=1 Tax=Diachasma alloeum TaxID=454923 RepID=UPI00073818D6|nr:dihydrofolate reductase [Diachasma alloeum]
MIRSVGVCTGSTGFVQFRSLSSDMQLGLNLIAAACEKGGIGVDGRLPWKLKSEMKFFSDMTTNTKDDTKQNVVLMGRRTWECIPKKYRPLQNRINMVLTSQDLNLGDEAIVCKSIPAAIEMISNGPLKEKVEQIWVIGGSSVYEAAMQSPKFHRLYLTEIKKHFECDTFFPDILNDFVTVTDPNVPQGVQQENGIEFEYKVYQRSNKDL